MDKKEILIGQMRESFGRVAYSHKTHEKMGDHLSCKASFFDWAEVTLMAISSGAIISTLFGESQCAKVIAAVLGSLALLVAVYQLKFKPVVQADVHRQAARKLWYIRERHVSLMGDLLSDSVTLDEGRKIRDSLLEELRQVYETAPATNSRAYKAAQDALKFNEELTFSDKEIDDLLPKNLRKRP